MEQNKLQSIITEKNEQLERATLREAESLIGEIATSSARSRHRRVGSPTFGSS